jgi:hypothetical protein
VVLLFLEHLDDIGNSLRFLLFKEEVLRALRGSHRTNSGYPHFSPRATVQDPI